MSRRRVFGVFLVLGWLTACEGGADRVPEDAGRNAQDAAQADAAPACEACEDAGEASTEDASVAVDAGEPDADGLAGTQPIAGACAVEDARACSAIATRPLICTDSRWQLTDACADGEQCDTKPGAAYGTCKPVLSKCLGAAEGQSFCATGKNGEPVIRTCGDVLRSVSDEPCAAQRECVETAAGPVCQCQLEYEDESGQCVDLDECAVGAHECEAPASCVNQAPGYSCECPPGYVPYGWGCSLSRVQLSYAQAVDSGPRGPVVSGATATLTVTPVFDDGLTVQIAGMAVASGVAWQSPTLVAGENVFTVEQSYQGQLQDTWEWVVTRGWPREATLSGGKTGGSAASAGVAVSNDSIVFGDGLDGSSATGVDGDPNDTSAPGSGAAYVFAHAAGAWTKQAYLKASNPGAQDSFGYDVAIDGDTIVVGAPGEASSATGVNGNEADDSAANSGAVYVFVRNGDTWTQQAYLKASNTGAADGFGLAVAISGDTLVVGAPREDSGATGVNGDESDDSAAESGAAYVFVRSAGAWTQQAYLKASNTGAGDRFGADVTISGDTVVIGAPGEASNATSVNGNQADDSAANSGAAYIFVRSAGSWTQEAYVKASTTALSLGSTVALYGDTLAVANDLSVRVFVRGTGVWSEQASLAADCAGTFRGHCVDLWVDDIVLRDPAKAARWYRRVDSSWSLTAAVYGGASWTAAMSVALDDDVLVTEVFPQSVAVFRY